MNSSIEGERNNTETESLDKIELAAVNLQQGMAKAAESAFLCDAREFWLWLISKARINVKEDLNNEYQLSSAQKGKWAASNIDTKMNVDWPSKLSESQLRKVTQVFGIQFEEVRRARAMRRLGLTANDFYQARPHFISSDKLKNVLSVYNKRGYSDKLPALTGMMEEQILRRKAVDVLGVTEDEIMQDRARRLSALGHSGSEAAICCH